MVSEYLVPSIHLIAPLFYSSRCFAASFALFLMGVWGSLETGEVGGVATASIDVIVTTPVIAAASVVVFADAS